MHPYSASTVKPVGLLEPEDESSTLRRNVHSDVVNVSEGLTLHQHNVRTASLVVHGVINKKGLVQCFSTAGPRPGTGPWHQLYRAARDSPGIDNEFKCNFIFVNMPHRTYDCTNTLYDCAIINCYYLC